MKVRTLVAAVGLAASVSPAFSATYNLGLLDDAKNFYHSFLGKGSFADIFTFTLPSNVTGVQGDTTEWDYGPGLQLDLSSATLTGTGIGAMVDANPNDGFAFTGLTGGGSYSLTFTGKVTGSGAFVFPVGYSNGAYFGSVSPVPEPEAMALALLGLLTTGFALRRRS